MKKKRVVMALKISKAKTSAEKRKVKVDTDWARFEDRQFFGASEQERAIDRHNRAVVSYLSGN